MRYAIIEHGIVSNVIVAGADWTPDGLAAVQLAGGDRIGPGWTYADGEFTAPEIEHPTLLIPSEFLALFTELELDAIQDSDHAIAKRARRELYTRREVDLTHELTQQLVGGLASIGLIAAERVAQVLAGESP